MDVSTAKTLVSALLVFAILFFSLFSFRMIVSEIGRDLKRVRGQRAAAGRRPPEA